MTATVSAQQRVRPMTNEDLERVLAWRNHEEVRRYMYTQHEISLIEHSRWFGRASQDSSRHLLVFENDAVPLGFINLHQIAPGGVADWASMLLLTRREEQVVNWVTQYCNMRSLI